MLLKVTFLNALRLIIGPLIFFSLITGILSLGDRDPAADRTPPGHDLDRPNVEGDLIGCLVAKPFAAGDASRGTTGVRPSGMTPSGMTQ